MDWVQQMAKRIPEATKNVRKPISPVVAESNRKYLASNQPALASPTVSASTGIAGSSANRPRPSPDMSNATRLGAPTQRKPVIQQQMPGMDFWAKLNSEAKLAADAEIAAELKAYQDQQNQQFLLTQQQEGANKQFLQENIAKMQQNKNQNDFRIQETENRFGGVYSGGLRLNQAANAESTNESIGNATRDVQTRNANLWAQYGQLAQQAQSKIAALTASSPERVQQYISNALQNASSFGTITGQTPWGSPTYGAQKDKLDRDWDQFTYFNDFEAEQQQNEATNAAAMETAKATQLKEQREYFTDLVNASDKLGYIVPELAEIIGVKPYSNTLSAKTQIDETSYKMGMLGVSKRNAATSERNAGTSEQRLALDREKAEREASEPVKVDAKDSAEYKGEAEVYIESMTKSEAKAYLKGVREYFTDADYKDLLSKADELED
jgi:hypothetical protein